MEITYVTCNRKLHVSYDVFSGKRPFLHVNHGEIVTLIGANGAGKSSTLMAIAGIIRSQSGAIRLKHHNIAKQPMHRLPPGNNLVPEGREFFLIYGQRKSAMGAYDCKTLTNSGTARKRNMTCFHAYKNASARLPERFREANNKCWPLHED
jgi:ABC-type branched-subunit amino acid transport system ATPase component